MEARNEKVVRSLERLLADSYTVYLKTHNYHWNVTGPMFNTLHTLFETQYTELALAVDAIAERIRTLGAPAPGSYAEFARLTGIAEASQGASAKQMVETLVADQGLLVESARNVVQLAEAAGDVATADLGTRRIDTHEKNAWMLRSHLE